MIQFQEEEFLSKFKQFNEDILYITIGSVIALGLFGWLSTLIFSIEPCPLNHYERDELCFDCMAPLDNCAICSSRWKKYVMYVMTASISIILSLEASLNLIALSAKVCMDIYLLHAI